MASISIKVEYAHVLREIRKRMTVARKETAGDIAFAVKTLFERTTETIDESIRFRQSKSQGGSRIAVGTDSKKYQNIVEGFEYRTLLVGPQKKRQGFEPKTKVRVLASFEQVGTAYPDVLKEPLKAPGREFPDKIVEEITTTGKPGFSAKSLATRQYKLALAGKGIGI